jgi:radical SAM protein with 4Fe4S-binding SPASM domain
VPYPPPLRAVWELTWRCNLACDHCLVDAGPRDRDGNRRGAEELTTAEGLRLIDAMADLGVRSVTLTGGEPLFRRDWAELSAHIVQRGMRPALSTNGHMVRGAVLDQLVALDFEAVVVSIDGVGGRHDTLRHFPERGAARSSFAEVSAAIERLGPTPVAAHVITSVTADNIDHLPEIHAALKQLPVDGWMIQLAHPTGRARDPGAPAPLPFPRLEDLTAFLVAASHDRVLPPAAHTTIGYLTREEPRIRSSGRPGARVYVWRGCPCGKESIAFEPNGAVKGCPNQVGAPFLVGNVRDEPLADIWHDRERWHWTAPGPDDFAGACATCPMAELCGGGCPCTSQAFAGRLFADPSCLRAVRASRNTTGTT